MELLERDRFVQNLAGALREVVREVVEPAAQRK
jgi:hypothetical protein